MSINAGGLNQLQHMHTMEYYEAMTKGIEACYVLIWKNQQSGGK